MGIRLKAKGSFWASLTMGYTGTGFAGKIAKDTWVFWDGSAICVTQVFRIKTKNDVFNKSPETSSFRAKREILFQRYTIS